MAISEENNLMINLHVMWLYSQNILSFVEVINVHHSIKILAFSCKKALQYLNSFRLFIFFC